MANYRISFQLYSARNFRRSTAQLEALAAIGYDAVEPYGGNFDATPTGFRAEARRLGLAMPTAHMPLDLLDERPRQASIDIAKTLGLETVVLPAPRRRRSGRRTPPAGARSASGSPSMPASARQGRAEARLAQPRFRVSRRLPTARGRSTIILAGARRHVRAGHRAGSSRGGDDPLTEIDKLRQRIAAFHIKDTAPAGVTKDDGWTDVGAGTIDWKKLWPTIAKTGATLLVMEHDNPSDWRSLRGAFLQVSSTG